MNTIVPTEFQTDLKNRYPEVFEDESSDPYEYATKITFADVLADESLLGRYAIQNVNDFWNSIPIFMPVCWPRTEGMEGYHYFRKKSWLIGKGKMPKKDDLIRYRAEKLEMISIIDIKPPVEENTQEDTIQCPIFPFWRRPVEICPEEAAETTKRLFEDEEQNRLEERKHDNWKISQRKKKELAKAREKLVLELCAILDQKIQNSPENDEIHKSFPDMTVVQAKKKLIGFMKRPKILHEEYKSYQLHLSQVLADEKLLDAFLFLHTNDCLRPLLWEVKVCFPVKPLLNKEKREMLIRRYQARNNG